MSQTQTAPVEEYEVDPDVDGELAAELQQYSVRQNGKFVKGRVDSIKETSVSPFKIAVTVTLPQGAFRQTFYKPDPEHREFEQFAQEYGTGLVDISDLAGADVWCTKEDGDWRIARPPTYSRRLKRRLAPDLVTDMSRWKKILLAPVVTVQAGNRIRKAKSWSWRDMPPKHERYWTEGARDMFVHMVLLIGVILLILALL